MSDNPPPFLTAERIEKVKKIESKKCALDLLTKLLDNSQNTITKNQIFDALITREKLGSTCAGNGVAIPRAHMDVSHPIAALLIVKQGLEIETVDKKPLKVFLAFIIPEEQRKKYSQFIKKLNFILTNDEHLKFFTQSDNPEQMAIYFESLMHEIENEINNEIKDAANNEPENEVKKDG